MKKVVCIDKSDYIEITKGSIYVLVDTYYWITGRELYRIINDKGVEGDYFSCNFITLGESRKRKLNDCMFNQKVDTI